MKASIRQISEMTGFSPATVSNALNNKRGVNHETAAKILEAAHACGYLSEGGNIHSIRFVIYKDSGQVVSDTPFFSALIEGVEMESRVGNFETVIWNLNRSAPDYDERLKQLLTDPTSGILLLATELDEEEAAKFKSALAPVVVLDNWFDVIVKRQCSGECYLIRYADDFVCCFQSGYEAKVFRKKLEERFAKYGLEVAEEKTKVLEFGRFARQNRERRGEGKPDTFDFLGFTFYCGMDGKKQFFRCRVKTSKKKLRSKIKAMKEWIMKHRTLPLEWIFKTINAKLRGHYQYYAVTDNIREVKTFLCITKKLLFKWLNRRSQRRSYTWKTFNEGLLRTFPLLEPSIKVSLFYR